MNKAQRKVRRAVQRGGFSFTEILFAMMILGIGFIMVAAMFPVAIRQTQEVVLETTGASVAKSGASYVGRVAHPTFQPPGVNPLAYPAASFPNGISLMNFPVTGGKVYAYTGPTQSVVNGLIPPPPAITPALVTSAFWQTLSGNLILPTDSRYAWVPFYSRNVYPGTGQPLPNAQITIIAVQCRNGNYSSADVNVAISAPTAPPNLQGRPLLARFTPTDSRCPAVGGVYPDTVTFSPDARLSTYSPTDPPGGIGIDARNAVAEGCYVIVADDSPLVNSSYPVSCAGYVYRVGNPAVSGTTGTRIGDTWELMPGNDMAGSRFKPTGNPVSPPPAPRNVRVFVVGRGYRDLVNPVATVAGVKQLDCMGPAMDIAVFSTFISVQ